MKIISCSHGIHLTKKIANKLKCPSSQIQVSKFPDGELYIRFLTDVKNQNIILIQSFYGNINDCIIETLFAAKTAKSLGAKKITLVAPYFPYLRQDKRFKSGECISIKILAQYMDQAFDKIYILDPHLHRKNKLSQLFKTKSYLLSSNFLISEYIKKKISNPVIIGPDNESYKWAGKVAGILGCPSFILSKKRLTEKKVKITINKKISIKNKNVIIVDDIISTGNTIIQSIKKLKKLGAKKFYCIAVHGIFSENALKRIKKLNVTIITTNSIPNPVSKIDISGIIVEKLRLK